MQVSFTLQELAREVLQRNLVHDLNVNDIDIVIVDIIFGRCSDWLILWSMRVHGNILGEDVMLRYGHVISSHSFVPYDNSVKSAVINAGYSVDQLNSLSASDGGGNYGPLSCFYDLGQKLMQESMFTCTVLTTAWKAYSGENIPISEARSCRSLIILHVIDRLKSSRLSADDESQSSNWKEAISSFLRCCREILFNSYLSGAMVLDMAQNCLLVGNLGSFAAVSLSELGTTRSVDSLSSIQRFMRSKFSSLFGCSGEHGFVQFVIGHFSDRTQYCIEIFISWTRLLLSDPEVPGALAACPRIPLSIFQKVIDRAASILSAPSPEDSLAGALLVNRLLDIMDDLAIAGIMVCSSQFLHGFSWQSVSDEMACLREVSFGMIHIACISHVHLDGRIFVTTDCPLSFGSTSPRQQIQHWLVF